jgi:pyrrolidone-carboxylate peptidase
MVAVTGDYAVRDNRRVTTLESGDLTAHELGDLIHQTAVNGSGGGYLSNEISYRVIHRVNQLGSSVRCGHIHVPKITGYDTGQLETITTQARELIDVAVQSVCN